MREGAKETLDVLKSAECLTSGEYAYLVCLCACKVSKRRP